MRGRLTPFDTLLTDVIRPKSWEANYRSRNGRFSDLVSLYDEKFPSYNANAIQHADGAHVLLEGPAQHMPLHAALFLSALSNKEVGITDVIAAGNPLDGRTSRHTGRGFLNYFGTLEELDKYDSSMRLTLISYGVSVESALAQTVGKFRTYKVKVEQQHSDTHEYLVHNLPDFVDFEALSFSVEEVHRLLEIFNKSKGLAIHCSAGMGRTGVLELAYHIYKDIDKYYPGGEPDFAAIKLLLEELCKLRPALVQTGPQYRMAIILGMQLHMASANQLSIDESVRLGEMVERKAKDHLQPKRELKVSFSGYEFFDGEEQSEETEGVLDVHKKPKTQDNSPRPNYKFKV